MSKYGWSKGRGLGADESGITAPLCVQVEKRKKKSDAEGGGFREPGGRGKIIGGQRKVAADGNEEGMGGKFGEMSEVVVLRGMVEGMDLDAEVEGAGDGGLMQEIGEECAEKVRHGTIRHDRLGSADSISTAALREFISTGMALRPPRSSSSSQALYPRCV